MKCLGCVLTSNANDVATWQAPTTDNLGNHITSPNLQLGLNYLSSDGGNEGIFVDGMGQVGIGDNAPRSLLDLEKLIIT